MALTREQYLAQQAQTYEPGLQSDRQRRAIAIQQAKETALQGLDTARNGVNNDYTTGIQSVNQERDQTLPTFQVQRNGYDAQGTQRVQQLRNNAANNGLYRSGSTVSEEAAIGNQVQTQIHDADTRQTQFLTNVGNRVAELERVKAAKLGDIEGQIGLANKQYGDNLSALENEYTNSLAQARAKAEQDWNQYEQQQQAQLASRSRSGGSGGSGRAPSATEIQRQGYSGAYQSVEDALSGGSSLDEVLNGIYRQSGDLSQYGVDPEKIAEYARNRYRNWGNSYSESLAYRDAAASGNRGMGGFVPQ